MTLTSDALAIPPATAKTISKLSAISLRTTIVTRPKVTTRARTCRLTHIGVVLPRTDRFACSIQPSLLSRPSPYALWQHMRVQLPVGKPAPRHELGPETKT